MRFRTRKLQHAIVLAGIAWGCCLLTGCVAPKYAPHYSDTIGHPAEGPAFADVPAPAQAPRSSKGDLIRMAEHQQGLIRALRRRVKELENKPEEASDQPDNLIPQEELAPMSTSSLGRAVDRQQRLIAALKARIRELENKKR